MVTHWARRSNHILGEQVIMLKNMFHDVCPNAIIKCPFQMMSLWNFWLTTIMTTMCCNGFCLLLNLAKISCVVYFLNILINFSIKYCSISRQTLCGKSPTHSLHSLANHISLRKIQAHIKCVI